MQTHRGQWLQMTKSWNCVAESRESVVDAVAVLLFDGVCSQKHTCQPTEYSWKKGRKLYALCPRSATFLRFPPGPLLSSAVEAERREDAPRLPLPAAPFEVVDSTNFGNS